MVYPRFVWRARPKWDQWVHRQFREICERVRQQPPCPENCRGYLCNNGGGPLDDAAWLDDFEDFIENRSEEMERSGRIDP